MPEKTVLGLDTSGKSASCAVFRGSLRLCETTFLTSLTHSQIILPTMLKTLEDAGLTLNDIDLFSVAAGPGSYTGLRIGIAAVKGLCALGKPCIGVSTLESNAYCSFSRGLIVPVMYARPGVYYFGAYNCDGESISEYAPDRVGQESEIKCLISEYPGEIILCGDGCEKIKAEYFADDKKVLCAPPNLRSLSASGVCMAALARYSEAGPAEALRARYLQETMAEKLKDMEA